MFSSLFFSHVQGFFVSYPNFLAPIARHHSTLCNVPSALCNVPSLSFRFCFFSLPYVFRDSNPNTHTRGLGGASNLEGGGGDRNKKKLYTISGAAAGGGAKKERKVPPSLPRIVLGVIQRTFWFFLKRLHIPIYFSFISQSPPHSPLPTPHSHSHSPPKKSQHPPPETPYARGEAKPNTSTKQYQKNPCVPPPRGKSQTIPPPAPGRGRRRSTYPFLSSLLARSLILPQKRKGRESEIICIICIEPPSHFNMCAGDACRTPPPPPLPPSSKSPGGVFFGFRRGQELD